MLRITLVSALAFASLTLIYAREYAYIEGTLQCKAVRRRVEKAACARVFILSLLRSV